MVSWSNHSARYKAIFLRSCKRSRLWRLRGNDVVDSSRLHAAFLGKAFFTLRLIMVYELHEKWTSWFYISSTMEKIFKGALCLLLKSILLVFNHNYRKTVYLAHMFCWLVILFLVQISFKNLWRFPSSMGEFPRVKYPCDCKYILPGMITSQYFSGKCLLPSNNFRGNNYTWLSSFPDK